MKSIQVDDKEKKVIISVHMEQVYRDIKNEKKNIDVYSRTNSERKRPWRNKNYMKKKEIYDGNVFSDFKDSPEIKKKKDYTWILDFNNINEITLNAMSEIDEALKDISKKAICNVTSLNKDNVKHFEKNNYEIINELPNYFNEVFCNNMVDYLLKEDSCRFDKIDNKTGERIINYINLKPLLENHDFMFPSCYLLAEKIWKSGGEKNARAIFCHTLNGAAIASAISVILGCDVLYADNLNTSGNLRKKNMPNYFRNDKECIIVTDMICQGHELIRAMDIVKMLGGICIGSFCLVSVKINGRKMSEEKEECWLLQLDEKLQNQFGYKIEIGY